MSVSPRLFAVIPTSGSGEMLQRTLSSLAECGLPENYVGTYVVENGAKGNAEELVKAAAPSLNVTYTHVERANKSNALNQVFDQLDDGDLVFLTDDDIRFTPDLLVQYAAAADGKSGGFVFGGSLRIDAEAPLPLQWKGFVPGSLTGWEPSVQDFSPKHDCFLGANWAVFAGDIKRAGGFDPRFGPGSPMNATGQEWNMQRVLKSTGAKFVYLPNAVVWHYVEYERYDEDFLVRRKYRGGVEHGIVWADRMQRPRLRDRVIHPYLCAKFRYFAYLMIAKILKALGQETAHLRCRMEAEHARGMIYSYPKATLRECRVASGE